MISTTLKDALTLSIKEFNEWAEQKGTWCKMPLAELKGVFTEKMKRNVAMVTEGLGNIFKPNIIDTFQVQDDRILSMSFAPSAVYGKDEVIFLQKCNMALSEIDYNGIPNGVGMNLAIALNTTISSINNFKITT